MTPDQFRHQTPNEFTEFYEAKVKNRRVEWEFEDMMNARLCEIVAKCAGNADVKAEDFLLIPREEEERIDSPETLEEKLKMLTMSLGGKVVSRG